MKKVIIVGAGGQDGRLLAENLGVRGATLRLISRSDDAARSVLNAAWVENEVKTFEPDELYYLAAFHHSADDPGLDASEDPLWQQSWATHVTGYRHCLEAVRRFRPGCRVFYAGSAHMFGFPEQTPQDEKTAMEPRCAYGITKVAGLQCGRIYREEHRLFVSTGILFSHESPLRPARFLSRKIIEAACRAERGEKVSLPVGDLSARNDWGWAPDYVEAMRLMLSAASAGDYVVATGQAHTVEEFVEGAFGVVGRDWRKHVRESPSVLRKPSRRLVGEWKRLRQATGWAPTVDFSEMITRLIAAERQRLANP